VEKETSSECSRISSRVLGHLPLSSSNLFSISSPHALPLLLPLLTFTKRLKEQLIRLILLHLYPPSSTQQPPLSSPTPLLAVPPVTPVETSVLLAPLFNHLSNIKHSLLSCSPLYPDEHSCPTGMYMDAHIYYESVFICQ